MILSKFFGGTARKLDAQRLPVLHSFVDVAVAGRAMKSVSIEELGAKEIVTRETPGTAGDPAVFVYTNPFGKFRFATKIIGVKGTLTRFELPARIEAIGGPASASQKRSNVRLDLLVAGFWRFAPGGQGVGEFLKGSIRDISRGGCALIADRRFKLGSTLEIRLNLRTDEPPLEVLGEVVRAEQIPSSGKFSHGLRFLGIRPEEDRAILEFINRKQTELRNRGLA